MPYTEIDTELLLLAASNSDRDHQEVADRLCDMTPEELRVLRLAIERLDGMLDALALDRHLRRE